MRDPHIRSIGWSVPADLTHIQKERARVGRHREEPGVGESEGGREIGMDKIDTTNRVNETRSPHAETLTSHVVVRGMQHMLQNRYVCVSVWLAHPCMTGSRQGVKPRTTCAT
jgi:hypothetical protein